MHCEVPHLELAEGQWCFHGLAVTCSLSLDMGKCLAHELALKPIKCTSMMHFAHDLSRDHCPNDGAFVIVEVNFVSVKVVDLYQESLVLLDRHGESGGFGN